MTDDRLYLQHIAEAIRRIEAYAADGQEAFTANEMAQDAVMRNFEIIGEAAKRLSDSVKQRRPDVPWREIAGFRDVLIHSYMSINLHRVWLVIEHSLPALRDAVKTLLREE